MNEYVKGNKEAWEEAFNLRHESWGANIEEQIQNEDYAFFSEEMKNVFRKYDLEGKAIGQFCCNNGQDLLSVVKTAKAKSGLGFDIAENMVSFANDQAKKMDLPCKFVATDIYEINDDYVNSLDVVIITVGALCWFKDLRTFFQIVSKCMKENGVILILEQHPFTNMIGREGDEGFDNTHPLNCMFSYFEHEWVNNSGMYYMTGKEYESKTFTDYTHSMSEIIGAMCANHLVLTGMQELDYDLAENFQELSRKGFPLSMILEGRKEAPTL